MKTCTWSKNDATDFQSVSYLTGSQPLAVFLFDPTRVYNTKPAERVGPLKLSVQSSSSST